RRRGKAGEIHDEHQQQELARKRCAALVGPSAIPPNEQPAGNGDRGEEKERIDDAAIRQQRIEQVTKHAGRSQGSEPKLSRSGSNYRWESFVVSQAQPTRLPGLF